MTLDELNGKLSAITEHLKRVDKNYRWIKWEYRIIIALLTLCGIINFLIAWRIV